jgi:hypothetical protein
MVMVFNGVSKERHKFTTTCYFILFTVENKMACLLPLRVWTFMCSLGTQHVATSASTSNISAANLRQINLVVAVENMNINSVNTIFYYFSHVTLYYRFRPCMLTEVIICEY